MILSPAEPSKITFILHVDAYIDLHSGDGYEELIPYVYYVGDKFSKGDLLGTISDYFGNMMHEIRADEDGILLHQSASLNIIKDGAMISYGRIAGALNE